jgi:hypothetical protein
MRKIFTAVAAAVTLALPATAQAAVISSWSLASNASDSVDGNNGTATDVVFSGSYALFNGTSSHIAIPYNANLSPGSKDVTVSVEISTTSMPGTTDFDFDLVRSARGNPQYKIELYPHSGKAQAQCIFHGSLAGITFHKGPSLNDGGWHTIVCRKTSNAVTITIDGVTYTTNVAIGDITHKVGTPFSIGWKPQGADFYHGLMRNVSVTIG